MTTASDPDGGIVITRTVVSLALRSGLCGFAAATTIDGAAGVTGIGGVFFKAQNPEKPRTWYREHFGIDAAVTGASFLWHEVDDSDGIGRTVWLIFAENTDYFGPGEQQLIITCRVNDLDALLALLREQGVRQVGRVE